MKKYVNIAFIYAIAALVCGVFYREFTKFHGFTGKTTLAFGHVHLLVMGTFLFLIIAIFSQMTDLTEQKTFVWFLKLYQIGLPFMVIMFLVRGILQTLQTEVSGSVSASISGLAGISHILVGTAVLLLFMAFRKCRCILKRC